MSNPMVRIHNVTTGEIIDREMNADELAQLEADKVAGDEIAAEQAKVKVTKEAAQAKLAAFGLTAEDLKALGL
jgi:hypothetical protein